MRNAPISINTWHRLGHQSYAYLQAIQRFLRCAEAGFKLAVSRSKSQDCEHCLLANSTRSHSHPPRSRAEEPGLLWYTNVAGGGQCTPSIVYGYIYRTVWVESTTQLKVVMYNDHKNDAAKAKNTQFWIQRVLPLFRKNPKDETQLYILVTTMA